jgi:hypothetical protein
MNDDAPCTLNIFGSDGKLVYSMRQLPVNGLISSSIDLGLMSLSSGVYFVEINNGKERKTAKWVRP